jgi:SAM-dependent methyltransferase
VDTVNQKLSYDPLANTGSGPQGLARRAVLRGIRPYSYHQDELNEFVGRALGEIEGRISDLVVDSQSTARRLERRIAGLEGISKRSGIETMSRAELTRMLDGLRARPAPTHPAIAHRDADGHWVLGFEGAGQEAAGYRDFEDIFRGSEEEIARRQQDYLPIFAGAEWVLDIGCGRGEFLDLLRDNGLRGVGVDLDETMIARCLDKGHEAVKADAAAYLEGREDGSVPAVFAAQVIEHLGPEELRGLLALLEAKLVPGGVAVLETVNPHSPPALKAFWTDTTHHHPLFPEVALALCRLAGFDAGSVLFPGGTGDFESDVYESRDYAVVARKAGPAE